MKHFWAIRFQLFAGEFDHIERGHVFGHPAMRNWGKSHGSISVGSASLRFPGQQRSDGVVAAPNRDSEVNYFLRLLRPLADDLTTLSSSSREIKILPGVGLCGVSRPRSSKRRIVPSLSEE